MGKALFVLGVSLVVYGTSSTVFAQTSSSPNYQIDESFIGPGGSIESNSPNYRTLGSVGDTAVGEGDSPNFTTQAGYNTTDDPRLLMFVNTSSINFGGLSTSVATTATATFSVLNYTAHGYGVFTIGNPPKSGNHTLSAMSSTGPSQPGTEQFGINLVANTSPISFGANPVQIPSSDFSYGGASNSYDDANDFRYVPGEQIALSSETSGQTNFTISYIVNVSSTTPGGIYSGAQTLVVVGTY